MDELPADWRSQVVRQIAGRAPLDGGLFAGSATLSPLDQIGIYREQYALRLGEAVRDDLLGLRALVGFERLDAWVTTYLAVHPSRTWSLARVAHAFPDWLAGQSVRPVELEMARVDLAVQRGFTAPVGTPLSVADLVGLPALALAPDVTLLWNTTNAHVLRSALLAEREVPAVEEGLEVPLVLHRKGLGMRHQVLEPGAWHVLSALSGGAGVLQAIEEAVQVGALDADDVESAVARWFTLFAERRLVMRRSDG